MQNLLRARWADPGNIPQEWEDDPSQLKTAVRSSFTARPQSTKRDAVPCRQRLAPVPRPPAAQVAGRRARAVDGPGRLPGRARVPLYKDPGTQAQKREWGDGGARGGRDGGGGWGVEESKT